MFPPMDADAAVAQLLEVSDDVHTAVVFERGELLASNLSEDEAAASIAAAIGGEGVTVERAFTGRSNLFAAQAGVPPFTRRRVLTLG